jgi:chromodomain-helicase-DNA-binding protein 7
MGLGKTIQTICYLHQLRNMKITNISGPFLIVAPLSLVDQWYSEISMWSPEMNVVLLHGNNEARTIIEQNEYYYQEPYVNKIKAQALKKANVYKFNILLTTYEVVMKDIRILSKIDWQVMIIDEAHKLKNSQSKVNQVMSTIRAYHCVMLTGTPFQNSTEELWSLLNFADPTKYNNSQEFKRKYGDLKDASQVASLYSVTKSHLLRRVKEDVEKSLPPKENYH